MLQQAVNTARKSPEHMGPSGRERGVTTVLGNLGDWRVKKTQAQCRVGRQGEEAKSGAGRRSDNKVFGVPKLPRVRVSTASSASDPPKCILCGTPHFHPSHVENQVGVSWGHMQPNTL